MTDLILATFYVVVVGCVKTRESILCTLFFSASAIYSVSGFYDTLPTWANHLIVTLIFLLAIIFSTTKMVSISLICYTLLHIFGSFEFIFFSDSKFLMNISRFELIAAIFNLCIMASILYDSNNYDYKGHRNRLFIGSWIINLCHHTFKNTRAQKSREGQ